MNPKKKIYCFNNGGAPRFLSALAIAEDGTVLAEHCCSHEAFMRHDLGMDGSTWKHERYDKHYGAGQWELIWIANPDSSAELKEAVALNKAGIPEEIRAGIETTYSDGTKVVLHPS